MISWDWLKYIATAALDAAYLSESDTTRHDTRRHIVRQQAIQLSQLADQQTN